MCGRTRPGRGGPRLIFYDGFGGLVAVVAPTAGSGHVRGGSVVFMVLFQSDSNSRVDRYFHYSFLQQYVPVIAASFAFALSFSCSLNFLSPFP